MPTLTGGSRLVHARLVQKEGLAVVRAAWPPRGPRGARRQSGVTATRRHFLPPGRKYRSERPSAPAGCRRAGSRLWQGPHNRGINCGRAIKVKTRCGKRPAGRVKNAAPSFFRDALGARIRGRQKDIPRKRRAVKSTAIYSVKTNNPLRHKFLKATIAPPKQRAARRPAGPI